ncbi:phosphotransferase [Macrococcus sp. DPC7161]|uniref:phosphotransferase n=1 Tax=Macrococcus sp. DPC7161 TaxID=2507060 RepID=UPI00100C22F8|nr:phosphotransferase [Macrococcus sp. DPC7161]RXK18702.1 hypothetical protein ER639_05370 [Macrococcus sp. DPC7161]
MDKNIALKVLSFMDVSEIFNTPCEISGGLLHKMYKVETDKGIYAVKQLNKEIISRPEAPNNYIFSEKFASYSEDNNINAICAKYNNKLPWIIIENRYYMVFDWIEAYSLKQNKIENKHLMIISKLLSKLHHLNYQSDLIQREYITINYQEFDQIINKVSDNDFAWGIGISTLKENIKEWVELYNQSMRDLKNNQIISHRDLDSKNVLWEDGRPYIIDWESAGYINPTIELIDVASNWSRDEKGKINKDKFNLVISCYRENHNINDDLMKAMYGNLGGMLGWLLYNMKRTCGIDNNEDEKELGHQQVVGTYNQIRKYIEEIPYLLDGI